MLPDDREVLSVLVIVATMPPGFITDACPSCDRRGEKARFISGDEKACNVPGQSQGPRLECRWVSAYIACDMANQAVSRTPFLEGRLRGADALMGG